MIHKLVLSGIFMVLIITTTGLSETKKPGEPENDEKKHGFQDIAFGTSKSEMKGVLKEKFGRKATTIYASDWANDFMLGNKKVRVNFYYDHNKQFYKFTFEARRYSADRFDTAVVTDGMYLNDVFKKKYGKPSKCYKPNFLNVRQGFNAYLCTWNHKDLEIYTALTTYKFKYYAVASVASKKMQKALAAHKKKQKKGSATKGADAF